MDLLDVLHVIPNTIEEICHPCLRLSNLHSFSSSDSFSLELCDPFMELAKQVLIPLFEIPNVEVYASLSEILANSCCESVVT